jgi:hypothetical protein
VAVECADMDAERIWREKPDDELVEAGRRLSEFTAEGERIIRTELRRRGLPDPPNPVDHCWKCGRGIYEGGPDDACVHCGEPFVQTVRARLGAVDEPLVTAVVYQSRFLHEVNLVAQALEEAGIPSSMLTDRLTQVLPVPAVQREGLPNALYTVAVPSSDAAAAREIVASLPVSHPDDGDPGDQCPPNTW